MILTTFNSFANTMDIITLDKSKVVVQLIDSETKTLLLKQFHGQQDNTIRKKHTARTFRLSDGSIIVEFYDKNAILIENLEKFKKLEEIRFVKNTIWNLKKNISYKIELTFEEGNNIVQIEKPKKLKYLKSEMPEYFDFDVYQLNSGQILLIDKSQNLKSASIYPDLKTLSSENSTIAAQVYNVNNDEYFMKKLASGDPLLDYEPNEHLIYPKYEKKITRNHKLKLIESKVFVDLDFYGNLFKSDNGYYILIDDFNQLNVSKTEKISIGTLRIYKNLDEVRKAQKRYEDFKNKGVTSEHFYQKISDTYGQDFPNMVNQLIDKLPELLNFDKEQLSIDSSGIDLIDEALKWNGTEKENFDNWFPSVLAFYGQAYITIKKEGKWTMLYEKNDKVWIPQVTLNDGLPAWKWRNFYKDLYEGPIPLKWVGDWDGRMGK